MEGNCLLISYSLISPLMWMLESTKFTRNSRMLKCVGRQPAAFRNWHDIWS